MPRYHAKHLSISTIILVVLLAVACIGGSIYFINSKRELNDDNLLSVDEYQIVDEKTSMGLKVDVKEDGKIYVSGKASEDWEAVIQTVTLDEGTYTVGGCNSNVGTYGIVVKKDGNKEYFDRNKLLRGIITACHKRPVDADAIAREIEQELHSSLRHEVTSEEIGERVMEKLRAGDDVAYVRFASVYKEFSDVETFTREIRRLKNDKKNEAEQGEAK